MASYEGEYVNGKKEGLGKMKFPNKDMYHGMWKQDMMSGEGTMLYSNGDIYSGSFVSGILSGKGTYEYLSDKSQLSGDFINGTIMSGMWKFQDGGHYQGDFEDGKPYGDGIFTGTNGIIQSGEFCKSQENEESPVVYTWKGGAIATA